MKQVKKRASKKRRSGAGRPRSRATGPDNARDQDPHSAPPEGPPAVRFSATIHARGKADPDWMEKLEIDRVPDPKGLVRGLVTPADCVRLLDQGFEVRLHSAYSVQPLDPALVERDDAFKRWLDERVQAIRGAKRDKPRGI